MGVLCTTSFIGSGVVGVAIHSPSRFVLKYDAWQIYEVCGFSHLFSYLQSVVV